MRRNTRDGGKRERGSAMVIAVLVTVILTLLGISYLLMAETENRIAENERLAAQALFAGEAGARMVKKWFDRPGDAANLVNPGPGVIDRTLRMIDADGDPLTPPVAADGTAANPYYKQGVDRDADGVDDVFEKPYRSGLADTLLGTEDGPDMRIDETFSAAAKTFLEDLSGSLLSGYPSWQTGMRARITRIDVYAPPYIRIAGVWTRYGMATVKVMARIYRELSDGSEQVLGERMIKAVLNETPFPGPYGPLHSCSSLTYNGDFKIHWGAATSVGDSDLSNNHMKIWASIPRVQPAGQRLDGLFGFDNSAWFANYKTTAEGSTVEDPWFRFMTGGVLADAPNGNTQPFPFPVTWNPNTTDPLGDGEIPDHVGALDGSHSNVFQNMSLVTCPDFDYEVWKGIATSGTSDVHYYVWSGGTTFKENGFGPARTFREITDNQEGLYFFDTADGIEPYDTDGDGLYDNLTPEIVIQGGTWGFRGFMYLNATSFRTEGLLGRAATFNAPGEPFQDIDEDGVFEPGDGESWINLSYPLILGNDFVVDASDTLQDDGTMGGPGSMMRNTRGPDVSGTASLWGILYTNGFWDASGNATYYGSVVSRQGIGQSNPTAGTPDLYWDENITKDWPPETWDLPRVIITRWETDL